MALFQPVTLIDTFALTKQRKLLVGTWPSLKVDKEDRVRVMVWLAP